MTENIPPMKHPAPVSETSVRSKSIRGRSIKTAQDDIPTQAIDRSDPERVNRALEHARIAARIADDSGARDIVLLDLRRATPLLDFFVIATANSRRLSHAIASEIDAEMKKLGEHKHLYVVDARLGSNNHTHRLRYDEIPPHTEEGQEWRSNVSASS